MILLKGTSGRKEKERFGAKLSSTSKQQARQEQAGHLCTGGGDEDLWKPKEEEPNNDGNKAGGVGRDSSSIPEDKCNIQVDRLN